MSDRFYYAARASEERRLAMASADPNVRRIHLEMADRYAAFTDRGSADEMAAEPEQKTA